jgi:hypothetical protein
MGHMVNQLFQCLVAHLVADAAYRRLDCKEVNNSGRNSVRNNNDDSSSMAYL